MMETFFVERYMGVIPNRINPYTDWGKGEWWETPTVTKTSGEGFLYTTLRDQLIFGKKLQNSNQDLFIKSQTPQIIRSQNVQNIYNIDIHWVGLGAK